MNTKGPQSAKLEFRAFDPASQVKKSARNLPHWFQAGAVTFLTFRTADSLPREVVQRWQRELESWLARKGLPVALASSFSVRQTPKQKKLLATISAIERREYKRFANRLVNRSLDECHGACLMKRPDVAEIVAQAILHYNGEKYDLDSFVIMPNHVHVLAQFHLDEGFQTVSQSWLRYSARQINKHCNLRGTFWQPEPFDHLVRHEEQFHYLRDYIALNPEKANLSAGEFYYWKH